MKKDEALEQFDRMHANWSFLDFSQAVTADVWYEALKKYDVGEVRVGITKAISELKQTPTVAEIVEYVDSVRKANRRQRDDERRYNANLMRPDAVHCQECHDYGYQVVIYPGDVQEYSRICPNRCEAALKKWGRDILDKVDKGEHGLTTEDLAIMIPLEGEYGGAEARRRALWAEWKKYREVELNEVYVSTGEKFTVTINGETKEFVKKRREYVPGPRKPTGIVYRGFAR